MTGKFVFAMAFDNLLKSANEKSAPKSILMGEFPSAESD
ncbi:Uncharacterized protein dnm_073590 [Desulfonema magnum]|uniref:Uncharacterized protein n=1 Tax=Desulfonema magnum TaxID=45655 RepID=A0A975BTC6_9BACT|nr:Uncharacterized protein dnm_073590 [Desulfonema magnum]